jgi:hypothetical protein
VVGDQSLGRDVELVEPEVLGGPVLWDSTYFIWRFIAGST